MQGPTEEAEASIPTEDVREVANLNHTTFTVHRKVAKRTFPWDQPAREQNLGSPPQLPRPLPPPPLLLQAKDIRVAQGPRLEVPVMKKRRLKEPFSASTDEEATHFSSHDTVGSLLVTAAAASAYHATADHADADPVRGNRTTGRKKKCGKEHRTDWAAVEDAVQSWGRRHDSVDSRIVHTPPHTGHWTTHEDNKLKYVVQEPFSASTDEEATHFSSHDTVGSLLVTAATAAAAAPSAYHATADHADADPVRAYRAKGRKKKCGKEHRTDWAAVEDAVQSWGRRHDSVDSRIVHTPSHTGHWTIDEDNKLKYGVQMHSGKRWGAIAALISGRTQLQCYNRWHDVVGPSIARAPGRAPVRTGKLGVDEDDMLRGTRTIQTHSDKDGDTAVSIHAVAAAVADDDPVEGTQATGQSSPEEDPTLNSEVTIARKKKYSKAHKTDWAAVEDAVQAQRSNNWGATAEVVPEQTQIRSRTQNGLWTTADDCNLTAAVQTHGGKDWVAIAALVPGRTRSQCYNRWYVAPIIYQPPTPWPTDEVVKLISAIQMYGDKDWAAISSLVPGRTERECYDTWLEIVDPSIDRTGIWWTTEEDDKLKYVIHTYGENDWFLVSALVPGRTESECRRRLIWLKKLAIALNDREARESK
jgi:hypothetical protein